MAAPLVHTTDEAAEQLRVKPSWLQDKAAAREIPFTMVGGSYHFTDAHLHWILARFEVEPEQPRAAAPRRRTPAAVTVPAGGTKLTARTPRRLRTAAS